MGGVAQICENHIMNNNTEDVNNKGYIFANLFDIVLYGILSILFPTLDFIILTCQTSFVGLENIYDLLFAEFFITATFFYDFYSRYRDCKDQTKYVVNVLFYGRTLFFLATLAILIIMFLVSKDLFLDDVQTALTIIAFLGIYPAIFAVIEAIQRLQREKKRKITKAH